MRTSPHQPRESLPHSNQIDEMLACDPGSVFTNMSGDQLEAIFASISEAVYVLDGEGNLVYANQAAVTSAGFETIEQILSVPIGEVARRYELYDRDHNPVHFEQLPIHQALSGEAPSNTILCAHNGSKTPVRWIQVKATPIFDEKGDVRYVVTTLNDVTQRIQAEETLRQQVQIIDQLQDAVISTDMDGYILSWNHGAERLFGYNREEMIGTHIYLLYEEGERTTIDYRLIAPQLDKSKYNLEMKLRNKSGKTFYAHLSLSKMRDSHGNPIGMIVYAMDITAKKRVEEELNFQLQQKTLLARLNTLIASARDLSDALSKVCSELAIYLEVPQASASLIDFESMNSKIVAEFNPPETPSAIGMMVPIEGNLGIQALIESKLPLAVHDAQSDPGLVVMHELFEMRRVQSTLIVPIIIDTRVIGTLNFESFFPRVFDKREISTVQQVANQIGQVLIRKHTEQELRQSESKFRSVVENSPAGIIIADDNYKLTYVNDRMCSISGYTSDELLNQDFRRMLDDDIRESIVENYRRRQRGEDLPNHFDLTFTRKDGVKRQLVVTTSVIRNSAGEMRTIAQIVDATENKIAEKLLRDSEERFRGLVQNSSDLVSVIDSGFNFQYVSPSVESILGYDTEELVGKNMLEFTHPNDIKHCTEALSSLLSNPKDISVLEHRYRHKDGSYRWFESTGSNQLKNPSINGIVGNTREITERKLAEEALRNAKNELEKRVSERTHELTQSNQALQKEIEERERAEVQMRAYLARVEALARVAERLNLRLDLGAVLKTLCQETAQTLHTEGSAVLLYDEETELLEYAADFGAPDELRNEFTPIPFELIKGDMESGNPLVVIPDVQTRIHFPDRELYERVDLRTIAAAPMYNENNLLGVLVTLSFGNVHKFSAEELSLLQAFANQGAVSIANAGLFEQVHAGRSRLQTLSEKLVDVQEAERRHLARELHDEIGQTLTSLKLKLEMITSSCSEKNKRDLEWALETITQLMRQVRELSLDLRPSMLDDLGLLPALLHLYERYTNQTSVQVNFQHNGINQRFSPTIETTAYRVVQEALTNTARYAGVKEVTVRMWCSDNGLEIQVQDNGIGFDIKTITRTKYTGGLTGMHERVILAGGRLELDSAPGKGTQLSVELPLQHTWFERREYDR